MIELFLTERHQAPSHFLPRQYLTENFANLKVFLGPAAKYRLGVLIQYT